jgi:hypothetical protein
LVWPFSMRGMAAFEEKGVFQALAKLQAGY